MSPRPIDLVLAEARRYLSVREIPRNSNRAVAIDYWLTEVGVPVGLPWCAAFVWSVGRQALGTAAWPLPRTAGCQALYDWAKGKGLVRETPAVGDVFVLWEANLKPARFGHTGFIVATEPDGRCHTLEGNTNDGGSRDGYGVFARVRRFGAGDRFLRWSEA